MPRTKTKFRFGPKPLLNFFRDGWNQLLKEDPNACSGTVQIMKTDGDLSEMTAIDFWEMVIKEADEKRNIFNRAYYSSTGQSSSSSGQGSSQGVQNLSKVTETYLHRLTTGDYSWFLYQQFPGRSKLIEILRQNINVESDMDHAFQMKLLKALYVVPTSTSPVVPDNILIIDHSPIKSPVSVIEIVIEDEKTEEENCETSEHNMTLANSNSSEDDMQIQSSASQNDLNDQPIEGNVPNDTVVYSEVRQTTEVSSFNYQCTVPYVSYPNIPYQYTVPRHYVLPSIQYVPSHQCLPYQQYIPPTNSYLPPQMPPTNFYLPPQSIYIPPPFTNVTMPPPNSYFVPQHPYMPPNTCCPYSHAPYPYPVHSTYYPTMPQPSYVAPPPQQITYPRATQSTLRTPPRRRVYYAPRQNQDPSPGEYREDIFELPPIPPENANLPKKEQLFSSEEIARDAMEFDFQLLESDREEKPIPVHIKPRNFRQKRKIINNDSIAVYGKPEETKTIKIISPKLRKPDEFRRQRYYRRNRTYTANIQNKNNISVVPSENSETKNPKSVSPKPVPKRRYFRFRRKANKDTEKTKIYTILKKTAILKHKEELSVQLDDEEKALLQNMSDNNKKFTSFKIKSNIAMLRVEKLILDNWGTLQPRISLSNNPSLEYIPQLKQSEISTMTPVERPTSSVQSTRISTRDQATQTSDTEEDKKKDREVQTNVPKMSYAAALQKKTLNF